MIIVTTTIEVLQSAFKTKKSENSTRIHCYPVYRFNNNIININNSPSLKHVKTIDKMLITSRLMGFKFFIDN